ncbi:MAG: ArnT family glycosyltransferase [Betaproteobacteria bacterium]
MSLLIRQPRPFCFVLLALALLASIFGRPDIPIDETRYVSVAWEMWSGGGWLDYLVPHRNGLPYHHKPPLLFWLINLGWMVFGVSDWWPRVISALFSLSCLPLTAAIAARLWRHEGALGERTGWLLLGGAVWLLFSTSVVFDVMLTAFVLLALLAILRAADGERRSTWGLFGLAIGLGILTKGPVVLLHVLPVSLLAPWWAFRHRINWRRWYKGLALGVLLGAAIALLWAAPAAAFGGEEFREAIFWGQTAGRISGSLAHRQPFWFYLAILPVLLFPWIFWGGAWRALFAALGQHGEAAGGVRFCVAWILPTFIGFSLAGGKQLHYILPLLPASALLLALGMAKVPASGRLAALPVALVIAVVGGLFLLPHTWTGTMWLAPYAGPEWMIGGALLVVLAGLILLTARGEAAPARLAMGCGALVIIFQLAVLRPMAPIFDMAPMGQRLKALEMQDVPVAHVGAYNDQYHFYGRLTRPLQDIARNEIVAWLDKNPRGRVVAYLKRSDQVAAVQPEFWQPYLEGAAVLLDARSARRMPDLSAK